LAFLLGAGYKPTLAYPVNTQAKLRVGKEYQQAKLRVGKAFQPPPSVTVWGQEKNIF
jgi:hypothetical protein